MKSLKGYEVAKMAVAQTTQGRGIGRLLLTEAIAWAKGQGAKRLYLESSRILTPALHLYESVGFRHLPPEKVLASPYARADVFMEMLVDEN
jgi:GNAT superfamily N-acetyltransferase